MSSNRIAHVLGLIRAIGLPATIIILTLRVIGVGKEIGVRVRGDRIKIRPVESDLFVLSQIFGSKEYEVGSYWESLLSQVASAWLEQGRVPIIVDAGANIGVSSLYFSMVFPQATVVAVEPDEDTFELLVRNCAHRKNILAVNAALWSHDRGVSIRSSANGSWAHTVADGGLTKSMTLRQLISLVDAASLLVLKLDIEGAEKEVCRVSESELRQAPCILVEPHDFLAPGSGCLTHLFAAIGGQEIDTVLRGENIILFNNRLMGGAGFPREETHRRSSGSSVVEAPGRDDVAAGRAPSQEG